MERKKTNLRVVLLVCFTMIPMIIVALTWNSIYNKNTLNITNKIMSNKLCGNGDDIRESLESINNLIEENISSVNYSSDLKKNFKEINSGLFGNKYSISNTFLIDEKGNIITSYNKNVEKLEEKISQAKFKEEKNYFIEIIEDEEENLNAVMYKPIFIDNIYKGCISIVFEKEVINGIISEPDYFVSQKNLIINLNNKEVYYKDNEKWKLDEENYIINLEDYICENYIEDEVLTFSHKYNKEDYNIYAYKMNKENFVFISIVNYDDIIGNSPSKTKSFSLIILTLLLLAICLYVFYKRFFNRPIEKVLNTINKINKGDFSARYDKTNEEDIDKIGNAVNILAEKLEKDKKDNEKISYIDSLTKIDNRTKFLMDGTSILFSDEKEEYSLIKFDIDKFKYINDIHGYDFGDKIIKHIADTLKECMGKEKSFYARGTDDNFVVLLKETDEEKLIDFIDDFVLKFSSLKDERGRPLKINFSFGMYKLENGDDDFEKAIDKANIAQESAKLIANHKSTYAFYDFEMKQTALKERKIENVMYDALENKEFIIYLQAKNDLNTLSIVGAEALVRWISKDFGFISPGDFIPIFEKNGFVVEVDFYVFEEVCKRIRFWLDNNIEPVVISVNQSKRHLEHDDYIERLVKIIKKYKVPAKYIELEITEATVLHNIEKLICVIDELHEIGFKISIDDFGSGYSSLNLLKEINADILKIDREFLKEVEDSTKSKTIIRHVIEMAKELNIKTITEGVEKEEQAEFLRNMGCDMAQGFLYAKPIAIPDFEQEYIMHRINGDVKDKRTLKKEKRKKRREAQRNQNKKKK